MSEVPMEKLVGLLKRRGFVYPGSEIYGGLANAWDFGPLGAEMKKNIRDYWWDRYVRRRKDMVGIETALLMSTRVWKASGHLKEFSDPLIECRRCHARMRADEIKGRCPVCGADEFTEAKQFNLMLRTFLGPAEDSASVAYFRPETAQGMFVNFGNILNSSRKKLPFGAAQIGKAFRNEITPGNFIFRTREFEQMEIEYFIVPPKSDQDWEREFERWRGEMKKWIEDLGVDYENEVEEVEIPEGERAHYSRRTIDFEYKFPFGQKELCGLAYRTDFDLRSHSRESGEELVYIDEEGEKIVPHVIEPSWGVERAMLAALAAAYTEEKVERKEEAEDKDEEIRTVLKLPKWLAPVKVAVLPLSKKEELTEPARKLYEHLLEEGIVAEFDETQSIGKRYRRQDEIGTPYSVTFDFQSLEDKQVTIRDRDTMKQDRINIGEVVDYLKDRLI